MNERLTIQDLIDLLAEKHGMNRKDADTFVKEFFLLIEQALESDTYVKIKGLGTFRLIAVDSRESVNVNTGERFQIEGHTKVSFTPDAVLRDTINKPFGHFETVVLNEKTVLEDTTIDEAEEEEEIVEESQQEDTISGSAIEENTSQSVEGGASQSVEESKLQPIVSEISFISETKDADIEKFQENQELGESEELLGVEKIVEPRDLEVSISEVKDRIVEEIPISTEKKEVITQPVEVGRSAEEIIKREIQMANMEMPQIKKRVIDETITPSESETRPSAQIESTKKVHQEKSPVPYLVAIIIIVLLLCGAALCYVYFPDFFISSTKKDVIEMPAATTEPSKGTAILDTIVQKDTIAEVVPGKEEVIPIPVKEKKETVKKEEKKVSKTSTPVDPDSVTYMITGTKATYTVKEGETLTKVAMQFYGTKALWPYIVKYNQDIIKNPDNVPYGTKLKIPELVKK